MNKFWLLTLLLSSFPALADPNQESGQTAATAQPYPVRYPVDTSSTKYPQSSLAIGLNALSGQYIPAAYGNTAIGLNAMSGIMTSAAINNTALGANACGKITTGTENSCFGTNAGKNLTTSFSNILIGAGAGSGMTTSANGTYNIIMDSSNPASPCTSCTTSILIGNGTGAINGVSSTIIGSGAGAADTFGGTGQTVIGANVGSTTLGSTNTQSNVILIGASSALDVATTSTATVLGIGSGKPGTYDTSVGWGTLAANTHDSGEQTAFGYNALNLSNVARAIAP